MITDNEYEYWKQLKNNSPEAYKCEKEKISQTVVSGIEETFPELVGKIEMTDVATPLTFHRYCNTYHGAYMAFIPTGDVRRKAHKGMINGLDNLYLAGQWAVPIGGLPMAAMSGKFAIQRICIHEGLSIFLDEKPMKAL